MIKTCPICKNTFETNNKRKKTCTRKCAGKSTIPFHKEKTEAQKRKASETVLQLCKDPVHRQKISDGLRDYFTNNPDKIRKGEAQSVAVGKGTKGKYVQNPENILQLSSRTTSKVLLRLNIGCSNCGWDKDVCDIHHIHGKKIPNANNHSNLCYLCPNCHRLAHKHKIDKLISLQEMIGEKWKEFYFG